MKFFAVIIMGILDRFKRLGAYWMQYTMCNIFSSFPYLQAKVEGRVLMLGRGWPQVLAEEVPIRVVEVRLLARATRPQRVRRGRAQSKAQQSPFTQCKRTAATCLKSSPNMCAAMASSVGCCTILENTGSLLSRFHTFEGRLLLSAA